MIRVDLMHVVIVAIPSVFSCSKITSSFSPTWGSLPTCTMENYSILYRLENLELHGQTPGEIKSWPGQDCHFSHEAGIVHFRATVVNHALKNADLLKKSSLLMILNFAVLVREHLVEVVLRGSQLQEKLILLMVIALKNAYFLKK